MRVGDQLTGAASAMLDEHLRECGDCHALADTIAPTTDMMADHVTLPAIDGASYALGPEVARGGMGRIRDDLFVTGNENGSAIATWDIHLETRKPAEIAKLVEERVPWRLEGGRLVRRDVMSSTMQANIP